VQPFIIDNKFANLIEMCRSRLVMDKVGYQLLLHDLTDRKPYYAPTKKDLDINKFNKAEIVSLIKRKLANAEPLVFDPVIEKKLEKVLSLYHYDIISLLGPMQIERIKDADFIKFETTVGNPFLAAAIVNTMSDKIIAFNAYLKSQKSGSSVEYLTDLSNTKRAELDKLTNALKEYKEKTGIINIEEQTRNLIEQVKNLEEKLSDEQQRVPALAASISDLKSKFTPQENSVYSNAANDLNRDILASNAAINNLNRRWIASNFDSKRIKDSIDARKRAIDYKINYSTQSAASAIPKAIRQELVKKRIDNELELSMASSNVRILRNEIGSLKGKMGAYAPVEAQIGAYERDLSVAKEAYMLVYTKLQIAQAELMNVNTPLRQVEVGQVADFPESSKLGLFIGLSIMVSLLICIVAIFMVEYFDQRVKSATRFRRLTNLPVISTVNLLPSGNLDLIKAFKQTDNPEDVTLFKAYLRHIRNILIEDGNQIFLFTGFNGNEGKTTLITSVAYSLALLNKKVLLIDANFKHNSLTTKFYAKQVLVKDEPLEADGISPTDLPAIDMIGTKVQPMSPAEILQTNNFPSFIEQMKLRYDFILIETASLEKNFDAEEMVNYTERIIAVFAAGEPLRNDDKLRLKFFHDLGDKFMGAVLNQVKREHLEDIVSQQNNKSFKWFGRNSNQAAASVVV